MPLPTRVRRGYALGSIVTGTFGTVPELLLLPYLTDTLGVAAVVAGLIVFVPQARTSVGTAPCPCRSGWRR